MKIKDTFNLEDLITYGFTKINPDDYDYEEQQRYFTYEYNLGHSRRGQFYSILINEKDRYINIYASEPDGSGGDIILDNILLKMFKDNIIE